MPRGSRRRSALLAAALLAATAVDASAHGGQYRKPGGALPPGLAPPTDATGGWWDANLDALIAEDRVGPVETGDAAQPELARRRIRESRVVPFLRAILKGEHGTDADFVAAASLALAKTTTSPDDVERLLALGADTTRAAMTVEAATIACGLLRRTDPALRLDPRVLDRVRARCLDVVDGRTNAPRIARCNAALAIGLLADQPTQRGDGDAPRFDLVAALLVRLRETDDAERQAALVIALGMQPAASVPSATVEQIRALA